MRERWPRTAPVLTLDEAEASTLLAPVTGGAPIVSLEPLGGGHSNTNIAVRLADATFVLRLYQRDPAQARKEAAIAALVHARVPAPRYLHIGRRDSNGQVFAIVEFVAGETLHAFAKSAADELLAAAGESVGGALAAIHGFTFDIAGFFDGDLKITPFPGGSSNAAFLETCFRGIARDRIGSELADRVLTFARRNEHRAEVWNVPPRLTHFDFGPTNILVRGDGTVAGIVDWEFAAAASPAPDFGNLLRPPLGHRPGFAEAVEKGYRDAGGTLPADWRELLRLADLGAWAEFMTRADASEQLVEDARVAFRQAVASEGRAS